MIIYFKILLIFGVTFFIFFSWYLWLCSQKRNYFGLSEKLIFAFVFMISQIYMSELLLGVVLHKLFFPYVVGLNILLSLIIFILSFKSGWEVALTTLKDGVKNLNNFIKKDYLLFGLIVLLMVVIARTLLYGSIITPFDWDGLEYHLPPVIKFFQEGKIYDHSDFRLYAASIFPFGQELLVLFPLLFVKTLKLSVFIPISFLLVGVLSIYSILKTLGLKKNNAVIGGLLFTFIPVVIVQLNTFYVDVAFSVLYSLIVLVVVRQYKLRKYILLDQIILGICLGWLLATKYTALYMIPPVLIIYLVLIWKRYRWQVLVKTIFILFTTVTVIAGYWYVKNAVKYHNPLAPYEIKVGKWRVFQPLYFNGDKGVMENIPVTNQPSVIKSVSWPKKLTGVWSEKHLMDYIFDVREGGLGILWWAIYLPSIGFCLIWILVYRKKDFRTWLLLFALVFVPFLAFGMGRWWTRYVIFLLIFGIYCTIYLMENFKDKIPIRIVLGALSFYIVLTTFTQTYWNYQTLSILTESNSVTTGGILYGNSWEYIQNVRNKVIIYGENRIYLGLMFGRTFENKVYYFQANDCKGFISNIQKVKGDIFVSVEGGPTKTINLKLPGKNPQKECLLQNNMIKGIIVDDGTMVLYSLKR